MMFERDKLRLKYKNVKQCRQNEEAQKYCEVVCMHTDTSKDGHIEIYISSEKWLNLRIQAKGE